jgi:chromosome segregation protein
VLGESRPTVLRCGKIQDVIFNGSEKRKSLSYCEISLFLDNENKIYPTEHDEVVVTRKLYRSGESEYLINRATCRKTDLIDLFRGTGIGRDSYSIIGQGMVAEILNSNDTRRKIFDEAAGIGRHKSRKAEAEKKLVKTKENMARLSDVVEEIKSKLAPLEKEAAEAIKFRELQEHLKFIEINHFLYQTQNSAAERTRLAELLAKSVKSFAAKEDECAVLNKDYNIAMLDMANTDTYANQLRDERAFFMVEAEKKKGAASVLTQKISSLREQINEINRSLITHEARIEDKEREKQDAMREFNEKNALLIEKRASFEKIKELEAMLKEAVDRQEREIEASKTALLESVGKLGEIGEDHAKLVVERKITLDSLAEAKEIYAEKKADYDKAVSDCKALTTQLEVLLNEKTQKEKEKFAADKNYTDSVNELRETEIRKRETENRKNELDFKIKNIQEYIKDYGGYQDAVRRLMAEGQKNERVKSLILGTVGEVINVPKDLQLAIEVALGGAIQNIIAASPEDVSVLLDVLKSKGFGRATFLPLSTVKRNDLQPEFNRALDENGVIGVAADLIKFDKKFYDIISNLLGRTVIVEDRETAIAVHKKYRQGFRIVTLGGDLFAPSGAITGGSPPGKNTRILSYESELDELNKKFKSVLKEFEMLSEDANKLLNESEEISSAAGIIGARLNKLNIEIERFNVQIAALDQQAALHKAETDKILQTNGVNLEKVKILDQLIKKTGDNKEELAGKRTSTDDFIAEARVKFLKDKEAYADAAKSLADANIGLNALANETENLTKAIANAKAEISLTSQAILDFRARKITTETEIKNAEGQIDLSGYDEEDQKKADEISKKISEIDAYKQEIHQKVTTLNEKRETATKELNELAERKIREEGAIERLNSEIGNLAERIRIEYDLDYISAAEVGKTYEGNVKYTFEHEKAGELSLKLRRRIENMGRVNALAEEQFAEEKKRFDEKNEQYEDLVKTENDLMTLIDDLVSEMTKRFDESFKAISENFQITFKDLFGGGKSTLELEKGTSLLEANIEVFAQPPGKRIVSINALSGGERTLTAIAILFAIIKLNPIPFSILDEIDAALDEANARLLAQYMRKFSNVTQFVTITHKKQTMEQAEKIFGVTMEEHGVSKIVSISFEDALKLEE